MLFFIRNRFIKFFLPLHVCYLVTLSTNNKSVFGILNNFTCCMNTYNMSMPLMRYILYGISSPFSLTKLPKAIIKATATWRLYFVYSYFPITIYNLYNAFERVCVCVWIRNTMLNVDTDYYCYCIWNKKKSEFACNLLQKCMSEVVRL